MVYGNIIITDLRLVKATSSGSGLNMKHVSRKNSIYIQQRFVKLSCFLIHAVSDKTVKELGGALRERESALKAVNRSTYADLLL